LVGQQDGTFEVAACLVAVHHDVTRLVLQRTDELVDQAAEQCLLEEDEEHQQTDGTGQQTEAELGTGHFLECQEHTAQSTGRPARKSSRAESAGSQAAPRTIASPPDQRRTP
jgi:hypothetical protein